MVILLASAVVGTATVALLLWLLKNKIAKIKHGEMQKHGRRVKVFALILLTVLLYFPVAVL